jgi:hypothetical protein
MDIFFDEISPFPSGVTRAGQKSNGGAQATIRFISRTRQNHNFLLKVGQTAQFVRCDRFVQIVSDFLTWN